MTAENYYKPFSLDTLFFETSSVHRMHSPSVRPAMQYIYTPPSSLREFDAYNFPLPAHFSWSRCFPPFLPPKPFECCPGDNFYIRNLPILTHPTTRVLQLFIPALNPLHSRPRRHPKLVLDLHQFPFVRYIINDNPDAPHSGKPPNPNYHPYEETFHHI